MIRAADHRNSFFVDSTLDITIDDPAHKRLAAQRQRIRRLKLTQMMREQRQRFGKLRPVRFMLKHPFPTILFIQLQIHGLILRLIVCLRFVRRVVLHQKRRGRQIHKRTRYLMGMRPLHRDILWRIARKRI